MTINSHREAVVKEISYEELMEIFQVLGALDSIGSSLAADNLRPEDLKELEDLTEEMGKHCHLNSLEKYISLNQEIHKKIWEFIPNRFLQATIRYVNDQMLRYSYARLYAFRKTGVVERSLNEHKEIIEALKNKDKKKIKNLMVRHWGSLLQQSPFKEGLKEYLDNK